MALIFRMYKPEIPFIIRTYGSQRQYNHYETLRVSPTSSQKEIKQAFIKLSKEMHPDTSGKKDHSDFVKINEAYSVLGKEDTRRQYDQDEHLKTVLYRQVYYHRPTVVYTSQREWEEHMAGRRTTSDATTDRPNKIRSTILCLCLLFIGTVSQLFFIKSVMHKNQILMERSARYNREYNQVVEDSQSKTAIEQYNILLAKQKSLEAVIYGK